MPAMTTSTGCPSPTAFNVPVVSQPQCTTVSFQIEDEWALCGFDVSTYRQYFSGNGVRETDDNPGMISDFDFRTTTFDDADFCTLVEECSSFAQLNFPPYFSFQLYYRISEDQYVCTAYPNPNSDPSYFNIIDNEVGASYGFTQ